MLRIDSRGCHKLLRQSKSTYKHTHAHVRRRHYILSQIDDDNNPKFLVIANKKNRSKGPVLIGLEEIVQRQVGVGLGRGR